MEFIRTRLPDVMNSFRLPLPEWEKTLVHAFDRSKRGFISLNV